MIKILTDSAADFEQEEADKLNLSFLPIMIRFGEEEYADGVNLSHREFFEKLIESDTLPQTSQINEYRFAERFAELTADGSEVLAVLLSSRLSGTYYCAVNAAKAFGGKVRVVDSLNACIGEQILVRYALQLREKGASLNEIAEALEQKKSSIQLLAVLDTLTYLKKGGRISAMAAMAGELLSIKPVISVTDGEVKLVGKAIGSKKSNNLLTQLIEKCGGIDFSLPYMLGYSGLSDAFLQKYVRDSERLFAGQTDSLPSCLIGSTIGTHVGPNAIAVAFFAK